MLEKYKKENNVGNSRRRMFMRWFLYLFFIFLLFVTVVFTWKYYYFRLLLKEKEKTSVSENQVKTNDSSFVKNETKEKTDTDEIISDKSNVASSENYRIKQVSFGGNVIISNDDNRYLPLKIYDVKSEIVSSQEDGKPKFLITWRTNKEAISSVVYSKNNGSGANSVTENGYGFEHSVLLDNMEFSTIYIYKIKSNDRWGNKTTTEYFSAYTGEKSESIFDLVFNAVHDIFSWTTYLNKSIINLLKK